MCASGKSFEELSTEVDKRLLRNFMGLGAAKLPYLKKALLWHGDKEHCFTAEELMGAKNLEKLLKVRMFSDLTFDEEEASKENVKHPLVFIFDDIYNTSARTTGKCEVLFSLLLYKGSVKKESGSNGGRGDVSFEDESGDKRYLEVKEGNSQLEYDLSSKNLGEVKQRVKSFLKKIWKDFKERKIQAPLRKTL